MKNVFLLKNLVISHTFLVEEQMRSLQAAYDVSHPNTTFHLKFKASRIVAKALWSTSAPGAFKHFLLLINSLSVPDRILRCPGPDSHCHFSFNIAIKTFQLCSPKRPPPEPCKSHMNGCEKSYWIANVRGWVESQIHFRGIQIIISSQRQHSWLSFLFQFSSHK